MSDDSVPPLARALGRRFSDGVQKRREGSRPLSDGADRHGAYQWMLQWESSDGLGRVAEFDVIPGDGGWVCEAWAGAESATDGRFTRRFVGASRSNVVRIVTGDLKSVVDSLAERAVEYADALAPADLDSGHRYRSSAAMTDGPIEAPEPDA